MFTQKFGRFVGEGDTITCEVDGFTCTATLYHDDNNTPPDKRQDGFWPSLDPEDAGCIGPRSKRTLQRHMARAKEVMRAWEHDEWHYYGVAVTVERDGVQLTGRYDHALWGNEGNYPGSDNSYLTEVTNDLLPEALDDARAKIAKLARLCRGMAPSAR